MSDAVVVALIVGVVGPAVMALIMNYARRKEKEQDYKREDAVAARAEEVKRLLLVTNERVAASAVRTDIKLDVIHGLVDGGMTAALMSERNAVVMQLAMMKELIGIRLASGTEPSPEALAAIDHTEVKIAELDANLIDRIRQTRAAEVAAAGRAER